MIKGIIFDMDGVIIDSNHVHYENWNQVFNKRFGIHINKSEFSRQLGRSGKHFTEFFLDKFNIKESAESLRPYFTENFVKLRNKITLKKGVKEILPLLKKKYKIGLATGAEKEWAIQITTELGVIDYFDYIIAGNEVKIAKPEPEIFLKAAKVLKLKPEECVVIEDAELGLIAAKRAGMVAVSIPDEFTKLQDHSMADFQLSSIKEIPDLLLHLT